jgi:NADH:ubiquinone oxidoreductase subunit C
MKLFITFTQTHFITLELALPFHLIIFFFFSFSQVMQVIRANYETLKLKLEDSLDKYEPFSENPKEASFFRSLLRLVVSDFKNGPNMLLNPIQILSQITGHSNPSILTTSITTNNNNNSNSNTNIKPSASWFS